jgi:uncharacterized protein
MAVDHIRYDLLAQEALRGVVRHVLADAAKNGLPGDHHFYISFDTGAEGVRISPRLREQYPEEITIILQHQFWDLSVNEEGFEVGLSFGGVPERLVVPFAAIKGFFDPSVQFGLQFETIEAGDNRKRRYLRLCLRHPPRRASAPACRHQTLRRKRHRPARWTGSRWVKWSGSTVFAKNSPVCRDENAH